MTFLPGFKLIKLLNFNHFPLIVSYKLRVTYYELPVTSYKLPVTSYVLQITSYELLAFFLYQLIKPHRAILINNFLALEGFAGDKIVLTIRL